MRDVLTASVIGWLCCGVAAAADPVMDYQTQIKPLLEERCYACHGALKQEGGLRLDTAALAIRGGDSGPAIVPGDVAKSLLMARVSAEDEDERMPPEGEPLTAAQRELLQRWIAAKAVAPADEQPERDPREHWAFQKPQRPPVPQVQRAEWQRNPIDAFLGAALEQRELVPQAAAERRVWLRRVTLDLTGLPPTSAELDAFENDTAADAYDRVVTRLLDSPQYGERWGRHWMDIWRYSDWWGLGAEVRNSQKHMWHWRDWIIESMNEDKGYDQMVREMLAADELYPNDMDRLRAGGFLARQYFKFNRTTWLDGLVEHTSKAMLGLTTNCAKCHDHKYDPISHTEYYQLRAIFEPYQIRTDAVPGELDYEKNGIPRPFDCNLDVPTYLHIRGDDTRPDKDQTLDPAVPAVLNFKPLSISPIQLPPEAYRPGLRPFVVETHRTAAERALNEARKARDASNERLAELRRRAEQPETATPAATRKNDAGFVDDFSKPRPDDWEIGAGDWQYRDGHLVQSQTGSQRAVLRYRQPVPPDFEARLQYVPTGGEQWKSVGITFDVTAEGNEVLAYLSAHAGGPKAQVSYKANNGSSIYPAEGAKPQPIALQKPQDLTLRVRGNLVNVLVGGELAVAYQLPLPRQTGGLELVAFDAAATFHAFSLHPLADSVELSKPSVTKPGAAPSQPQTIEQAELSHAIANLVVKTAEANLASVLARAAADRAKYLEPDTSDVAGLSQAAALSERMVAVAKAEEALARAELVVQQAAEGKPRDEAREKLAAAEKALGEARKAAENPGDSYTSLPGALKTLESNVESAESRNRPFPETSTGRRAALAHWITDRENPLTARVAVNHIWARHFGKPLVATVFDFGRKGAEPTHPELLDWLAVEFMEQGWSMKHLHRLMVTSEAYRRSTSNAGADPATRDRDPENVWYWRANPLRMEAQVVRDSLLALGGQLDPTMGGPSIPISEALSRRRSLYFVHSNNEKETFLSMFDDANVLDCYRRAESIVPQQALALENSELAAKMAAELVNRLEAETPQLDDTGFVTAAFTRILSVVPNSNERQLMLDALTKLTTVAESNRRADPRRQARILLVQALLNHNDFVTIR